MFDELDWLTVKQLIVYHTLISVFRIRMSNEPGYLAQQLNRENFRGKIIVKNCHLELYQRSFVPRGSKLWNSLPVGLKEAEKIGFFKKQLKKWVMENVPMFEDGP